MQEHSIAPLISMMFTPLGHRKLTFMQQAVSATRYRLIKTQHCNIQLLRKQFWTVFFPHFLFFHPVNLVALLTAYLF